MDQTTQTDVLARMETLEAELARLKAQVRDGAAVSEPVASPEGTSDAGAMPRDASTTRRDLLRYGAVALGAAAAGLTARTAEAADGGPVLISGSNVGTGTTFLQTSGINATGLDVSAIASGGVGDGVRALTNSEAGIGVYGRANSPNGVTVGVWGDAFSPGGIGVRGTATQGPFGVHGQAISSSGIGVGGTALNPNGPGVGVSGECYSTTGVAVRGTSFNAGIGMLGVIGSNPNDSDSSIAMYGWNKSNYAGPHSGAGGFGVYGLSEKGHGLVGATAAAGGAAVVGATNGVAGAYAGVFFGPVVVTAAFTVLGAKSAAVPHPDGSYRRLYCLESPESWFEDFGKARLTCGEANVVLDPDFAAIADLGDYHVFVTPYDDHELRVSGLTPTGFQVRAKDEGASGRFSWRVVAKRKDIAGSRLETVTVPPEVTLPPLPEQRRGVTTK